ncbi:MAG: hypothetical protein WCW78_04080 [Candidatus Paceibacterota bacterium]|jgi:hypothetical protein
MTTEEIKKYSKRIKEQADVILKETNLMSLLGEFGTPHIIGSYAMDLMYNPDLDIIVTSKDPRKSSVEALAKIVEMRIFPKLEYGDFVKFKREKRPEGYIIVLKTSVGDTEWEIEVWFLPSVEKEEKDIAHIRSHMTPEIKSKILEFKYLVSKNNISKHSISSPAIYKAVIDRKIEHFDELLKLYS